MTTRPTKNGPTTDPDSAGDATPAKAAPAKQAPAKQPAKAPTREPAKPATPTGMPTGPATLVDVLALLDRYRVRAHRMARAQFLASKRAATLRAWLGVPAVIAGAVVGSSIIASISIRTNELVVLAAGVASLLTAGLTALQTFFGYAERAEKHRTAGATYTSFYRQLDLLALRFRATNPAPVEALRELTEVVQALDRLQTDTLEVPDRYYDRSRREQERDAEGV